MTVKVVWICDGCGDDKVICNENYGDWRYITVTLEGFEGYPISEKANGSRGFNLCPSCQRHLYDSSIPTLWPRPTKAKMVCGEAE